MKVYFNLDGDFIIEGETTTENVAMSRVLMNQIENITITQSSMESKNNAKLQIKFKREK
jgi:hypothetical protein